jgi:glycosyltransferase involved in cell wall biosynthesis
LSAEKLAHIGKLLFICGCLEPGKDGVGDYTRSLSIELADRSIEVKIISLYDQFLDHTKEEQLFIPRSCGSVKAIRLPVNKSWQEKVNIVQAELQNFHPDLVSFQVVPFAYNPYGILRSVLPYFLAIGKGFKTHLMFHELWIGDQLGAGLKEKILGFLERRYILKLISGLKPVRIHTTSDLNVFLLKKYKIQASKLPVFSNIKVEESDKDIPPFATDIYTGWENKNRENTWIFMFFGAIHTEWNPEKLMQELIRLKKIKGKEIAIASIGRADNNVWNNLKEKYKNDFTFIRLGERTASEVSAFLQQADFGISSYPDVLVEKSGSIAALRLHGLPVILSRDELVIPGFSMDNQPQSLLWKVEELEDRMNKMNGIRKEAFPVFDLQQVASRFLKEISEVI